MDVVRLSEWLQTIAAVGVIAGLGLVAYELRQQHVLARAQLASENFAFYQSLFDSFQEPEAARVYAKALTDSDSLTLDEQVMLDVLFKEVVMVNVASQDFIVELGIFESDPAIGAEAAGRFIFSSEYGRVWWEHERIGWPPTVQEYMDHAATLDIDPTYSERAMLIKEQARSRSEQ